GGYKTPAVQKPLPREYWMQVLDVVLLAAAMGISVWIVLSRRSRKWLLGVAIFFGRAFCGGVCALGAIQEVVLLRPITVPRRLDRALGLLRYVYLGLAIFFALKPALAREFLICRFDPFVGLFRRTGPPHMLIAGGLLLGVGMFVGRPYCR